MKQGPEICRDYHERREDIRKHELNGIDYLEVGESQTMLTVYFLGHVPPGIGPNNIRIEGGTRIRNIKVKELHRCEPQDPRVDGCLRIEVVSPGDFSTYVLRLVNTDARGRPGDTPLKGLDPRYAQIDFSFKANCPTGLDCAPQQVCFPEPGSEIDINYLARDYASFRQLILDRLSLIMPDWKERHAPDLGIALVELLAYSGDYLSYYQDAVATEAYLGTARQRISVRRHARLVDYRLSEGCNARAWVCLQLNEERWSVEAEEFYLISSHEREFDPVLSTDELRDVPFSSYEVFEPVVEDQDGTFTFYRAHNSISFYNWNDRECCLPRGATSATLRDEWVSPPVELLSPPSNEQYPGDEVSQEDEGWEAQIVSAAPRGRSQTRRPGKAKGKAKAGQSKEGAGRPDDYSDNQASQTPPPRARGLHLAAGDVLIFQEVKGPVTGVEADADPLHRHVVRLTKVEPDVDSLYDVPILKVEWASEDALPFPLCISAIGRAPECEYLEDVSVAHGNVFLVDHGRRVGSTGTEALESWTVPAETGHEAGCWAAQEPRDETLTAADFSPRLKHARVTYRVPFQHPSEVARQQTKLISMVMLVVHQRLENLWRSATDGRRLTSDEISQVRTIFGSAPTSRLDASAPAEEQARGLGRLLEHEDRLLLRKAQRVRSLAGRTRAGYVIGRDEEAELVEMFGAEVVAAAGIWSKRVLGPASLALNQDPQQALPCVWLSGQKEEDSDSGPTEWLPQLDLLDSDGESRDFVVEIDNYGRAHIRFGDDDCGQRPAPNAVLSARYRVGNGTHGNVGAEAISHFVFRQHTSGIAVRVRNPLPARGGIDPEPASRAKLFAPMTFRRQLERAVTRDDYAALALRTDSSRIQNTAGAPLRWTGSHYEVQVAIDPFGAEELDRNLAEAVEAYLYRYGRIGYDLRILPARYVPLDIELSICVKEHFLRADVEAALLETFSNRITADGRLGFFHPDNLSFGDGIYLSRIVAAAQSVEGVESATVARFQRLFQAPNNEIENGLLPLGPIEVALLDNDRNFPERGQLRLKIGGGR